MPVISRDLEELDLVNLERQAHILKGLSPSELETLAILLDQEATDEVEYTDLPRDEL